MVGTKSGANSMASWVGAIPGTKWRTRNDDREYGGIPSNLPAAMVLGHACQEHPPSTPNGVAEDFSSQLSCGIPVLFADGSVHYLSRSVNMAAYPFTASMADGRVFHLDF
jgi:hypothetical protein